MSIVIFKRPERTHKEEPSITSRWNSAHQPMIFGLQRKDFIAVPFSVGVDVETVGFIIPNFADYGLTPEEYLGVSVYCGDSSGLYDDSGVITESATVGVGGADLYITTDIPWLGVGTSTWFNIHRDGYRIEMTIELIRPTDNQVKEIVFEVRPFKEGRAEVQVQNFIKQNLRKELAYDYSTVNGIDKNAWGKFTLKWREVWKGNTTEALVSDPYTYYFVDGVKYIGNAYGQNFMDYIPVLADVTPAKFLTMFDRPTFFEGYPFSMGFIYPDQAYNTLELELPAIPMRLQQERFNMSNQTLNTQTNILDYGKSPGTALVKLVGTMPAGTDSIDVWLDTGTIVPLSYYESGYVAEGYFDSFPSEILSENWVLTEKKRVKYRKPCGQSPVYLRWRNPLGSWDYWCFDANYEIEPMAKDGGKFSVEPDELESATARSKVISIESLDRLTCGDVVNEDDWSGLKWIESSPCVQMLTDKTNLKWINVDMGSGGMKRWKRGMNMEIKVSFDLPNYYAVPN